MSLANKSPGRLPVIVTSPSQLRSCLPALRNSSFLLHLHRVSLLLLPTGRPFNKHSTCPARVGGCLHTCTPSLESRPHLSDRRNQKQLNTIKTKCLKTLAVLTRSCWSEEDKGGERDVGVSSVQVMIQRHRCVFGIAVEPFINWDIGS